MVVGPRCDRCSGYSLAHFGGIGAMFAALAHARPPSSDDARRYRESRHSWYISTVLLTVAGFYM